MTNREFTEQWTQLMGGTDEMMQHIRRNAADVQSERVQSLLQHAEQQRTSTEMALRHYTEQHQALMAVLDELQTELAVAGRPLSGEVS